MPPPEVHLKLSTPSAWVCHYASLLTKGSALDVACGGGRHSRWLLAQGFNVTCLDKQTDFVLDLNGQAEIITADLEQASEKADFFWPLTERTFDLIVVTNYLYRPLFPSLLESLNDSGMLIYETFMQGNEAFGRPRNPNHLLKPNELLSLLAPSLNVIAFQQGLGGSAENPAMVQRIVATKNADLATMPLNQP